MRNSGNFQDQAVSLTFKDLNKGNKMDRTTQEATGDPVLCPLLSAASLVQNTLSLSESKLYTPICSVMKDVAVRYITQKTLLKEFRPEVTYIGETELGLKSKYIGAHSVISVAAMAMFLENVPICLIMSAVRWSSDDFLKYIRKQVIVFIKVISSRIIKNGLFHTLPDMRISPFDPIT